MMTAAKGALEAPAEEMVEILVYLAENNKIFGETVADNARGMGRKFRQGDCVQSGYPERSPGLLVVAEKPQTGFVSASPGEFFGIGAKTLAKLAATLKGEWIDVMLASPRVQKSHQVLQELAENKRAQRSANRQSARTDRGKAAAVCG